MSEQETKSSRPGIDESDAERILISFGYHIRNSLEHSWFSEADQKQTLLMDFELLTAILDELGEFFVQLEKETVLVNGQSINSGSEQVDLFIEHMVDLEIPNFVISKGITEDDLAKFLDIIDARPFEIRQLGGFQELLKNFSVEHISTRDIEIVTITSEEEVARKEVLKRARKKKDVPVKPEEELVGNVLAFLKGGADASSPEAKDVQDAAGNPQKMAQLILDAAQVQQQETPIEQGETLTDFVVGCLKKTHKAMLDGKDRKTKTGRKRITKNLMLIQEQLLEKMREMSEDWTDEDLDLISETTMQSTDEMKIDSLANDMVTAREAHEKSQQELADMLQQAGGDPGSFGDLHSRLAAGGVKDEEWSQVLLKSRDKGDEGPGGGIGFGGVGEIGSALEHLDHLLDNLSTQFAGPNEEEQVQAITTVLETIRGISLQASNIVSDLNARISSLSRKLSLDTDDDEPVMSREEVVKEFSSVGAGLAPVVQLIMSAVDAITNSSDGKGSSKHAEMLHLVKSNMSETRTLMEHVSSLGTYHGGNMPK